MGEGCSARTLLTMMEEDGYQRGLFADPDWTAVTGEDFEESGMAFVCSKVFEKEEDAGHVTEG